MTIAKSIITKNGLLIKKYDWDTHEQSEELVTDLTMLTAWEFACELEKDLTLFEFFNTIEPISDILSMMYHFDFKDAYTELNVPIPPNEMRDYGIKRNAYIEVYHHEELIEYIDCRHSEDFTSLDRYVGMHGFHMGKEDENMAYSLSLTPLKYLANLPIRLKDELVFSHRKTNDNKNNKNYTIDATYLFREIVNGIIWELGFHGSSDDKVSVINGLNKQIEEIKSGEA